LDFCWSAFPTLLELIKTDFPEATLEYFALETFRGASFLDLLYNMLQILEYQGSVKIVEDFVRDILPHSQPYDIHLRHSLKILCGFGIAPDLLWSIIRPVPFDDNDDKLQQRGFEMLEWILPLLRQIDEIPAAVFDTILTNFFFVKLTASRPACQSASDTAKFLATKNPELTLGIVDRDLEKFCKVNLVGVVVVLEATNAKRPIIDYLPDWADFSLLSRSALIEKVVQFNVGPPGNLGAIVRLADDAGISKAARGRLWELIEKSGVTAEVLRENAVVNKYKLSHKVAFMTSDAAMVVAALNSWRAALAVRGKVDLRPVANLLFGKRFMPKDATKGIKASEAEGYRVVCTTKFVPAALVTCAKEIRGEGVDEGMKMFAVVVARLLDFVNDVLQDPKEQPVPVEELDVLTGAIKVIAELNFEFQKEPVRRLVEALGREEVIDKLQYQRAGELLAVASLLV
jgi:hypothetical protein